MLTLVPTELTATLTVSRAPYPLMRTGILRPIVAIGSRGIRGEVNVRIGELAKHSGTLVETIRYYEQAGLMPAPPRTPVGYREYRPEHLQRLIFLRRSRELGFSIEEIRSLLRLTEQRNQSCATVTRVAAQHLNDVRGKLADLRQLARGLQTLIDSCGGGQIADCKILEALTRMSAGPVIAGQGTNPKRRRGTQ